MQFETIHTFEDFCRQLRRAGFSMGGANAQGVFSLCTQFGPGIEWHTGDPQTDPWTWRIRALTECNDLAYGKLFCGRGGWITREWYPYFLAVRRAGREFDELYADGLAGEMEKRVYHAVREAGVISAHEIKAELGCTGKAGAKVESALTKLQMRMFVAMRGETFKRSKTGEPYGWPVSTFSLSEGLFDPTVFEQAREMGRDEAAAAIRARILEMNPACRERDASRFIG